MYWLMSYRTDAEKYAPLQRGKLTDIIIENTSDNQMVVTEVFLQFDWMGTYRWYSECNVKVMPGQEVVLPDVGFAVDLAASPGSHNYKPGIDCKLLEEGEWVTYKDSYVKHGEHIMVEPLPAKDYVVFVSHSNHDDDENLLRACKQAMRSCGLTGYFAEDTPRPGYRLWEKIAREIAAADALLVLWTKRASKSGDVREEIGIAVGSGKLDRIVPIVEQGATLAGSLKSRGIEWVDYKPPNHIRAISVALETIMEWAKEKEVKKPRRGRT